MRRPVILGAAAVAVGGLALVLVFLFRGPGGPTCPPSFTEFGIAPKEGVVGVSGRVVRPGGAPLAHGKVEANVTFMTPGCGAVPFEMTTDGQGRFSGLSPAKDRACVRAGGTATARIRAGCEIEGITQGSW